MDKINFSPDNIGKLFQQAVDEAIEQHRIKGESIAISENGKVKIIPPEKITPLADKLKKSKVQEQPPHKI
jgi:non-homologous end joining protein Ku